MQDDDEADIDMKSKNKKPSTKKDKKQPPSMSRVAYLNALARGEIEGDSSSSESDSDSDSESEETSDMLEKSIHKTEEEEEEDVLTGEETKRIAIQNLSPSFYKPTEVYQKKFAISDAPATF